MVFNLFDNKQSFIEIEKERIMEQIEFKKNEIESSTKNIFYLFLNWIWCLRIEHIETIIID